MLRAAVLLSLLRGIQRVVDYSTLLQHSPLPGCTGCLLRGLLAVTTTGLSPVSRRQLQDTPTAVRRCLFCLSQTLSFGFLD